MDETTTELVPITSPDEIASLPDEQRGAMITRALVESKSWLAVATTATDPTPIANFKAWAATVAEMTRQKGLAEDIQLDALEMVRRAERGIGVAIRNGQEAGELRKGGRYPSNFSGPEKLNSPSDFFTGGGTQAETYAMTDGVTDEQFDEVLDNARAEGNLSRANVSRKARRVSSQELPERKRFTNPRDFEFDGLAPICAVPVLREEKIKELSDWGFAGSQLLKELSSDERELMFKVLDGLESELSALQ